jgi:hypothetical protein
MAASLTDTDALEFAQSEAWGKAHVEDEPAHCRHGHDHDEGGGESGAGPEGGGEISGHQDKKRDGSDQDQHRLWRVAHEFPLSGGRGWTGHSPVPTRITHKAEPRGHTYNLDAQIFPNRTGNVFGEPEHLLFGLGLDHYAGQFLRA